MSLDPIALRDVYDDQLRAWMPPVVPPGVTIDWDGPLKRVAGLDERGFVTYKSLDGVPDDEVDALIARARDYFAARGQAVEWKLHGHDSPSDLPDRLRRAGFVPEDQETVVIGLAGPLAVPAPDPEGIRLREVTARADLERIAHTHLVPARPDHLRALWSGHMVHPCARARQRLYRYVIMWADERAVP